MFEIWKDRFKIIIQNFDLELWETIINDQFIPIYCISGEVVYKPNFLWYKEEKCSKFILKLKTF